jgi:hypothetical protein
MKMLKWISNSVIIMFILCLKVMSTMFTFVQLLLLWRLNFYIFVQMFIHCFVEFTRLGLVET